MNRFKLIRAGCYAGLVEHDPDGVWVRYEDAKELLDALKKVYEREKNLVLRAELHWIIAKAEGRT